MNILPPMATVWYHCTRKALGDAVDIFIFDCSGGLDAQEFPGARVQKFLNLYAAAKCQEFLAHSARKRRIAWLCDDDIFILSPETLAIIDREFQDPTTASMSFRPRSWWHFEIAGKEYEPSGSYCPVLNREIFIDREKLSLAPVEGNIHPTHMGKGLRRYDTFDKANEILLRKGYHCIVVPETERARCVTGFSSMSGAVMLLHYFRTSDETLAYLEAPPKEQWNGNVLYGVLAGLLAICTIQECYTKLCGRSYPLRSLPPRDVLEKIRRDREPYLRPDQSFTWVDEASETLRRAL
jgi:hypothetical protein